VWKPTLTPRAFVTRKEAENLRPDGRIPNLSCLKFDGKADFNWEEFYRLAWKNKIARPKKNDR
jgi:hypothetical protein